MEQVLHHLFLSPGAQLLSVLTVTTIWCKCYNLSTICTIPHFKSRFIKPSQHCMKTLSRLWFLDFFIVTSPDLSWVVFFLSTFKSTSSHPIFSRSWSGSSAHHPFLTLINYKTQWSFTVHFISLEVSSSSTSSTIIQTNTQCIHKLSCLSAFTSVVHYTISTGSLYNLERCFAPSFPVRKLSIHVLLTSSTAVMTTLWIHHRFRYHGGLLLGRLGYFC